jgi:Catechol dioxygenase N terminus
MEGLRVEKPLLKGLNADNITENTVLTNSSCEDLRMRFLMERLVSHLHDFARETRLSTKEWMAGIQFLTVVGQSCNPVRQVSNGQGPTKVN